MINKLFWLCLLLLIPGLLARISLGGVGILASDILLPFFSVVWIGHKIIRNESFPRNNWISAGLLFLCIATISWLFGSWDLAFKEKILSFAYIIRLASLFIFGWAAMEIMQEESDKKIAGLYIITGIIILLGFLQFFIIPDIAKYSTEGGWDPHTGRLLGTWLDPNYLAGFLGFILPVSIAQWYAWRTNAKIPRKYLWYLVALILGGLVALFLTFSRSGYLAAGFGILVFFLFRDWKVILIAVLVTSIGIISNERATKRVTELAGTFASIILQDTDEIDPTAKLRIQNWGKSYSLFEKNRVIGIGYNTYRYIAAEEGIVDEAFFSAGAADSTHLTVLVTTGLIGFTAYLWFLFRILSLSWRKFIRNNNILSLGFFAGFLSLIIHATFVNSLFFPLIFLPVMAIWGMISAQE